MTTGKTPKNDLVQTIFPWFKESIFSVLTHTIEIRKKNQQIIFHTIFIVEFQLHGEIFSQSDRRFPHLPMRDRIDRAGASYSELKHQRYFLFLNPSVLLCVLCGENS
jgi:hypothetical protein